MDIFVKNKRKILLGAAGFIFVCFECIMFYLIHFERSQSGFSLHYATIIAATLFSWLVLIIEVFTAREAGENIKEILLSKSNGNLIRIAMLFTLVADYFLVAMEKANNLAGVTVFIGTQVFIFLHIIAIDRNSRWRAANVITRIALCVILIIAVGLILGRDTDPLSIISVIYYSNLLANAIFAHRTGRGGIMLTIGLILFALCDINVGLSGLESIYGGGFPEGSLLYKIRNSDVDLIWLFYIPSQTLIPLSLLLKNKEAKTQE